MRLGRKMEGIPTSSTIKATTRIGRDLEHNQSNLCCGLLTGRWMRSYINHCLNPTSRVVPSWHPWISLGIRSHSHLVNSASNPGVFSSVSVPLPTKTRTPDQGYGFFEGYRFLRPLPDPYPYPWWVTHWFLLYFNIVIDIVMSNVCIASQIYVCGFLTAFSLCYCDQL
jgi:hypothetical protein